jgi:hypothetical protein
MAGTMTLPDDPFWPTSSNMTCRSTGSHKCIAPIAASHYSKQYVLVKRAAN